jgi:hypothetical protein
MLDVFADKLNSCTPYKVEFAHPFAPEKLSREIVGLVNGKCVFIEEMPNNGKMECKYSESQRKVVAEYYQDVSTAESAGTSFQTEPSGARKTYTINGKVVENPLDEAISSGICVISGY